MYDDDEAPTCPGCGTTDAPREEEGRYEFWFVCACGKTLEGGLTAEGEAEESRRIDEAHAAEIAYHEREHAAMIAARTDHMAGQACARDEVYERVGGRTGEPRERVTCCRAGWDVQAAAGFYPLDSIYPPEPVEAEADADYDDHDDLLF